MVNLKICRTPSTGQGYIEPLGGIQTALPLHMVQVPGGSFTMGSPSHEQDHDEREGPQHPVTLSPFFMGRYPITQAQWRTVAEMSAVNQDLELDPSSFKGVDRPVESVDWYAAQEFCARLAQQTGRPYRLPSESEWEYACRAGTQTPFYFGETLTDELANYDASYSYAEGPIGEYREETTVVNHFGIANGFGLSDMHGNVYEWCLDHWHDTYAEAPEDGSAWIDGSNNDNHSRVRRGGSWIFSPGYCRSADRYYHSPDYRGYVLGFRVVCSAPRAV